MKFRIHSIRWRLLLWQGLISLGLVIAVTVLADRLIANQKTREINRELLDYDRAFFRDMMQNFGEAEQGPKYFRKALDQLADGVLPMPQVGSGKEYLTVRDETGKPIYQMAGVPEFLAAVPNLADGEDFRSDTIGSHRVVLRGHPDGTTTLIGRDISAEQQSILTIRMWLGIGGGAVLAIALAGSWWVAGSALKPIMRISSTAQRIADGNTTERIQTGEGRSELDGLTRVLNESFDELEASIDRQKQFTADASHELRTPLAVLLAEVERGLRNGNRPAEEYRQILEHCQIAGKRMGGLVESLLMLARESNTVDTETWVSCDLSQIVEQIVSHQQPLADKRGSVIECDLRPAEVRGNAEQLEALVQNLVINALTHPPAGSAVKVRCFTRNDEVVLEVHDNGPGIPVELQDRVFERFFRADTARASGQKHSGLGLSIARSIANMHGATLGVESKPGSGTTFRLVMSATS